jgi:hypothetical protein
VAPDAASVAVSAAAASSFTVAGVAVPPGARLPRPGDDP